MSSLQSSRMNKYIKIIKCNSKRKARTEDIILWTKWNKCEPNVIVVIIVPLNWEENRTCIKHYSFSIFLTISYNYFSFKSTLNSLKFGIYTYFIHYLFYYFPNTPLLPWVIIDARIYVISENLILQFSPLSQKQIDKWNKK